MKKNKRNNPIKKIVISMALLLILAGLTLAVIKRSVVKKIFSNDTPAQTVQTESSLTDTKTNIVNYGPSQPTDNDQINAQKNNPSTTANPPINTGLTATITNTRVVNSLAQVSVLVSGTTTGTCKLTLSKDGAIVQKISAVTIKESVITCGNFDVPINQLSKGTWKASVILDIGSSQSSPAESTIQVGT